MSRVVASTSKSGLSTPGAPTSASTAVPPRAGFGAVATGVQPMSTTAASAAAAASRLTRMSSQPVRDPDVGNRADQEGGDENPRRPVDLALEAPARPITAAEPAIAAADGATQARGLGCLHEHADDQQEGEDRLQDDQRVPNVCHRVFPMRPI